MKRITSFFLAAALLFAALPSMAQRESKLFSFGFGIEGGIPLSDMKTSYTGGGGVTGRFSLHAGPGFVTFTAGGIAFAAQNISNNSLKTGVQIPIKAGYKYRILPHLFIMGELGYSSFRNYYEDQNNNVVTSSTGGFTYAPSIGANFGVLELAARYETVQLSGGNISFIGLRMGFNF
jgi:hypothetical protein